MIFQVKKNIHTFTSFKKCVFRVFYFNISANKVSEINPREIHLSKSPAEGCKRQEEVCKLVKCKY